MKCGMKCGNPKVFKMFCLRGDKIVFERERIYKLFDVSNLGGELEFTFVFILCFILLFICLSFHTCGDVFF